MRPSMIARLGLTDRLPWLTHLKSRVRIDPAGTAAASISTLLFVHSQGVRTK
jgi:hypothetical protein